MNNENLHVIKNSKEAREMGRKGGLVKSDNKKLASRLRELKKKGLTDENAKRIFEVMSDSNMSSLDILLYLNKIKGKAQTVGECNNVARTFLDWHKTTHGEKIKIDMQVHHVTEDIDRFFKRKGKVIDAEIVQEVKKDEQV